MPRKKGSEPQSNPDELALEQRVDAMMDPKASSEPPTAKTADTPIDIFSDAKVAPNEIKTAPELVGTPTAKIKKIVEPPADVAVEKVPEAAEPDTPIEPAPIADADGALDDDTTDEAVDEIVAQESDDLLAAQDTIAGIRSRPARQPASHYWLYMLALIVIGTVVVLLIWFRSS